MNIKLGDLIKRLEKHDREKSVYFDFYGFSPSYIDSYRGYYDQLAIGFEGDKSLNCGELVDELKAAVGKKFTGYKGGSYLMDNDTAMWVGNYGECHDTAIIGEYSVGNYVILQTAYSEDLFI